MAAFLRRYQDLKFQYDRDNGSTILLRQRVYRSQDGEIETPITTLFQARILETDGVVPPRTFTPRLINACFENNRNRSRESRLSVFVPYRPGDPNILANVQEIIGFNNVLSAEYVGETDNIEDLTTSYLEGLGEIIGDAVNGVIQDITDEIRQQILDIIINILIGAVL